jgi:hypothetical protein
MAYLARLIHRCAVHRGTVTLDDLRQTRTAYAVVTGLTAVECFLVEGDASAVQRTFGRDTRAVAMLHLPPLTDVRPNLDAVNGMPDKVVVTDQNGRSTTWFVLDTVNPGGMMRGMIASLTRGSS